MKFLLVTAVAFATAMGSARAQNACKAEIEKTVNDWGAIRLAPAPKPGAISRGVGSHAHVQAAVDSMRYHLAAARALCKDGNDHETLLHLGVIRAFLNLPEIQHPTDHRYLMQGQRR